MKKHQQVTRDDVQIAMLFSTPGGEKVLEYLEQVFFDKSVYAPGDPYHTAYQAGQQDVIGHIRQCIAIAKEGEKESDE